MFRSGAFVAEHVEPTDDDQVQPNGVDLTVAEVYEPRGPGRIGRDGTEIPERQAVAAEEIGETVPPTHYLSRGGYVVEYGERIAVPDGHVGFVLPRSSLLRAAVTLDTAVWDTGYEGRGEGLLTVHNDIEIERDARIAQFVLAAADHDGSYDGAYQGERLEE
jgi:dUTP pyrophosphatase